MIMFKCSGGGEIRSLDKVKKKGKDKKDIENAAKNPNSIRQKI